MKKRCKRFLSMFLAVVLVLGILPTNIFAAENESDLQLTEVTASEETNETDDSVVNPIGDTYYAVESLPVEPITGTITEDMVWEDGDVIGGVTISGDVTVTVKGTVTVNGTISLNPDVICNVTFNGENNAKLIRGTEFAGQMFYAEGVSGVPQNLIFNNMILDGGAVWTGDVDATLNRGTVNAGVKANGSLLYLVYANATLNDSVLQNHDDSTGEKANAVFLRYYSLIEFNNSVVRDNNSISTYYRGGVITVRQGGTVRTNNADVYGNSGPSGGFFGISATGSYGGVAEVKNSKFHNNYSDNGAVFLMQCNSKKGYLDIEGCEFYENASKTAVLTEWAYSRPFIIRDSYFHDNECAVWDCHADPVLDISGKIVVEEDADYTKYLFETPLVLTGALSEGSSISMSEASIAKLMNAKGYFVTGTYDYDVTESDIAKFVLPEGYSVVITDVNEDGIGDMVAVKTDAVLTEIILTLKDSMDAEALATDVVYAEIISLPVCSFKHEGLVFANWMDADGNKVPEQKFTETATLTVVWKAEIPVVTLSRENADLKATVTNASDILDYTYQWYIDNVAIEGATSETYTMTDVNSHSYKCVVTASKEGIESTTGSVSGTSAAPAVAQVGDAKFGSLKDAVAEANATEGGATVTLLQDVILGEKLSITGNVTISGEYTIAYADGYTGTLFDVEAGGTLTTKDIIIDGGNAFAFYDDTAAVENGQNWYTRFVDVGDEDKVVNADVFVNAGNLTLGEGTTIQNITLASTGDNGKTENTETGGYVLKYNDDVAIIKSVGGCVTVDGAQITGNAGMVLNADNTVSTIEDSMITGNMGCGRNGGIIDLAGGTLALYNSAITDNKAMARCATILGVTSGAVVEFNNSTIERNKHIGVGSNTAGSMIVVREGSVFEMNGGSISNNIGGRAGAIASRWATQDAIIQLNSGTIAGNTVTSDSWNNASIFLRSPAVINEGMNIDGVIAVNAAPAALDITGGTIKGDLIVNDGLKAAISGGTFDYEPDEWVTEECYAVDNGDGTWSIVDYVKWIKEQLLGGNDVTLEKDIVVDGSDIESIPAPTNGNGKYPNYAIFTIIGDELTIDLNGHDITYYGHKTFTWNGKEYNSCTVAHGLFYANAGADVTIIDSKGEADVTVYGLASGLYCASPDTKLTATGGNWVNKGCEECGGTNLFIYPLQGGEIYITGGYYEQELDSEGNCYLLVEHGGEYKNSVIDYSKTKLEISGGTFVGMNPEDAHYFQQTEGNKLVMGESTNVVAKGFEAAGTDENGVWQIVVKYIAENVETGVKYTDVTDALDAAKEGETVILLNDYEEDAMAVVVPAGVTFDLNGHYVTVNNFLSFGEVKDDAEVAGGVVIDVETTKAFTKIQEDNKYLPIYDTTAGCYRFFSYKLVNAGGKVVADNAYAVRIGLRLFFDNDQAYDVLATTTNSAMDVTLTLTWGTDVMIQHTFDDATVKNYATSVVGRNYDASSLAMVLTVKSLETLNGAELFAKASLSSVTEVVYEGENISVYK